MRTYKKWSLLLAAALMALSVAACAGSGASGSSGPAASASPAESAAPQAAAPSETPAEAQKVTIWYYWETPKHQETLDAVIKDFNGSQGAVQVEAKYVPFADFKKQLSIGATAAELPDIVIIDSPDHASYAAMGIFADLTGKVDTASFYDGPINSCTLDGKLYGVPFGSNCLSLFYNADLLEAAGQKPPTTWDELKATAKALTSGSVTGLAFCSLQNEEGTFNFMPWLWSAGADSFSINNEQGVKALTFVSGLVQDGSMTKECINWTQGDVMNQFISGNVAMMVNGPWQVPTMRQEAPDLNWDVTLIPKDAEFASVLGGENFAVINNDRVASSLAFIEYATSAEKVKSYIDEFGYIAARKDVAEGQFADDPLMKKFTEQLQYAKPRGPHARWPEISDAVSLAFNEAITQTAAPADAAAKAQATIDGILG